MNSKKLAQLFVELISIVAVTNGNFITFDGECPSADLKPSMINVLPFITNVEVSAIALTAPLCGINRTDYNAFWEHTDSGTAKITNIIRSTETGECATYLAYIKDMDPLTGAYDLLYQVAPNTNFAGYKVHFLSFNPSTKTGSALICHNLPDSRYQVEFTLLSASSSEYDKAAQDEVKTVLETNNLGYLNPYISGIEHSNKCY
ncbi:uncharacterized protein LOC123297473 [Chrysoperla carnea]|uniref:uncharacterized protein LOC123297473 n=1 Tax=Chrysoperla carnea TaxID=189513 RepID=UPI001D068442|nr:uncharacterized protein LOC123297473 [Chrysoperla carnea]